jgi:hypothetical protein
MILQFARHTLTLMTNDRSGSTVQGNATCLITRSIEERAKAPIEP